ncbi:MAG TPA: hypothetical protein DCY57_11955 [Bacteroidetes bacterium]|mgnify:FL=1|nr:hypothetical protein [Bacteroidota bacterium]
MVEVEICIDCTEEEAALANASAALEGGAHRIECCSHMDVGGLTVAPSILAQIKSLVGSKVEVLAMVRPHEGGFHYALPEKHLIIEQAEAAVDAGADGIVFGALSGASIDHLLVSHLMHLAETEGIQTTFHRAFDVLTDPDQAAQELSELGVDRILTAGASWESGDSAANSLHRLSHYIGTAHDIEWVIGGGVSPSNVNQILTSIPEGNISMHAYSSLLVEGRTNSKLVAQFVREVASY